jgi:hypothetical protein
VGAGDGVRVATNSPSQIEVWISRLMSEVLSSIPRTRALTPALPGDRPGIGLWSMWLSAMWASTKVPVVPLAPDHLADDLDVPRWTRDCPLPVQTAEIRRLLTLYRPDPTCQGRRWGRTRKMTPICGQHFPDYGSGRDYDDSEAPPTTGSSGDSPVLGGPWTARGKPSANGHGPGQREKQKRE